MTDFIMGGIPLKVLSPRLVLDTFVYDLSCFLFSDLTQDNLYMALARPQVMSNVVKIVKENIPEVISMFMLYCCLFKYSLLS